MTMRPLKSSGPTQPIPSPSLILKSKACISCRTRKVKCDKSSPCTNCSSWSLECVYPSPIRRCPRPRKKPMAPLSNADSGADGSYSLDERIQKVEKMLKDLTHSINGQNLSLSKSIDINGPNDTLEEDGAGAASRLEALEIRIENLMAREERIDQLGVRPLNDLELGTCTSATVISGFQPNFSNQQRINTSWSGGVFPFNYFASETASLLPSPTQIQICWRAFLENVDQLAKVLHTPSAQGILRKAVRNPTSLNNGQKALLFAIFFSSIASMSTEEAESCFNMDKATTMTMYRTATEQALTAADFLITDDLVTFQAVVLFISFSRFAHEAKLVWALTGLARRLCPSSSSLSPFIKEMHKRLKWQLWYLDRRAEDDHGKDTCSPDPINDWELPLSINDTDLDPNMAATPAARKGWTEMSFCLVRFEIAKTSRLLEGDFSQHQKERMINECGFKIQKQHLRYCDNKQPVHWLAQHVSYVMISEMWIKLYNDEWLSNGSSSGVYVTKNQILLTAIDIVDTPRRLETEPQAKKWKWLLPAYLQYHPLAFLLNELCHQQYSDTLERAWKVSENAFERWTDDNKTSTNGVFLLKLRDKAKSIRGQILERQRSTTGLVSGEPPNSQTDITIATADYTHRDPKHTATDTLFFIGEDQFEPPPIIENITDDMNPLDYLTFPSNFPSEPYDNFQWCGDKSHLEILSDITNGVMLSSEYQF